MARSNFFASFLVENFPLILYLLMETSAVIDKKAESQALKGKKPHFY